MNASTFKKSPGLRVRALVISSLLMVPLLGGAADEKAATPEQKSEPAVATDEASKNSIENSVVKIFAQVRRPELTKPWTKQSPREITGSGMVIEGKRILTNAHVVLYASQVQVQASQSGEKISATVEAIAPGIDLAVLKLEDETFFDSHAALPRVTALPQIKDPVLVYGFPTGGTSISITKGIVSRIEFTSYRFPVSGLRVQIDAAINPGNSGGPALVGDKVIGLAFSHLQNAQNIGYIIPSEEIDLFLKDVADGEYSGKPVVLDDFQTLENSALRAFLKLDKSVSGLVANQPFSTDASYPLKKWDVVTKIGDVNVDDQGMVKVEGGQRLRMSYLVQKIAKNGKLPLTVVRAGKSIEIELPVTSKNPRLIRMLNGEYPDYFILGPIVFSAASEDIIQSFASGNQGAMLFSAFSLMGSPLVTRRGDMQSFEGEELVVVAAPYFPHKLSKGYSNQTMRVVESINGIKVKNLQHLAQIVRDSKDEFFVIQFAGNGGETPVFPRAEMIAATEEILNDNGVRAQGSPDLLKIWEAKKPAPASTETAPVAKPVAGPVKKKG